MGLRIGSGIEIGTRIGSGVLAVFIIVSLLLSFNANAVASNNSIYTDEVTAIIDSYLAVCNGRYWNKNLSSKEMHEHYLTPDKWIDATTDKACPSEGKHERKNNNCTSNAYEGVLTYPDSGQCQAFASYMADVIFGENSSSKYHRVSGKVSEDFRVKPGDIIRYKTDHSTEHAVVVYKVKGDSFSVIQCNGSGKTMRCRISVGDTFVSPKVSKYKNCTMASIRGMLNDNLAKVWISPSADDGEHLQDDSSMPITSTSYASISSEEYIRQCSSEHCDVILTVTTAGNMKSMPCSVATNTQSTTVEELRIGNTYSSTRKWTNTAGNIWYEVICNGKRGFIYSGDVTVSEASSIAASSTLSVSGNESGTPSGTLKKGSKFGLRGEISSNYNITYIEAHVYDSNGLDMLNPYKTEWNKKTYNIKKDGINNAFSFGSLASNKNNEYYRYVVTAADASAPNVMRVLIDSKFRITDDGSDNHIDNSITTPVEPALTSAGYNMIVDVGKGYTLRFCSSWSTDKKYEVASIPNGTVVYVYGITVEQFDDRTWAKINYNGNDGWVNFQYLNTTGSTTIEAPILLAPNIIEDEPTTTPALAYTQNTEPEITPISSNMKVDVGTGSTLRFCSTVSIADEYEVDSIPNEAVVYVYGMTTQQYEDRTWAKINYNGMDGWVNYKWLAQMPSELTPAPAPSPSPTPEQKQEPDRSIIDLSQYYGQWVAGAYYSEHDIYDDMLTIEPVGSNEISLHWELYRIAGFYETATVDLQTGIAQFTINDSWSGTGHVVLGNGTVTMLIDTSTFIYVPDGDEHLYIQKRDVSTLPPQPEKHYDFPVLSISDYNSPSDMEEGSNFGIRGIIQTNCGLITDVWAYVYDMNDNPVQTSHYTPGETSHDLRYSINNDLVFGRLTPGNYSYVVEAQAVNGDQTSKIQLIYANFTVNAVPQPTQPIPEPEISTVGKEMQVNVGTGSTLRFCSTVSTDDAYEICSIANGEVVYVYGTTYQKYKDRTWAKINYAGRDGWVNFEWLSLIEPDPVPTTEPESASRSDIPVLSISEYNVPSDVNEGTNFGIRGIIQTNCGSITDVWAYLYDDNNSPVQSSHYTPGETSHDLRYSINNDLIFGKLSPGRYRYIVEAKAVNGDQTEIKRLIDSTFEVKTVSVPQQNEPEIKAIGKEMKVNVGKGSTLRFCATVSRDDAYEIGSIPNGTTVYVYGTTIQKYEDRTWAKIRYDGRDGWVNYEWLS